jgi:hypothetical protein
MSETKRLTPHTLTRMLEVLLIQRVGELSDEVRMLAADTVHRQALISPDGERFEVVTANGDLIRSRAPLEQLANSLAARIADGQVVAAKSPEEIQAAQRRDVGYAAP